MKDSGCREEIRIIRLYFIFFPYDIANFDIGFEVKFKSDVFCFGMILQFKSICYAVEFCQISLYIIHFCNFRGCMSEQVGYLSWS